MAGESIGDAYVEIGTMDAGFSRGLNQAQGKFATFSSGLARMAATLGVTLSAGMAVKAGFKEIIVEEQAERRLSAALRSHGDAVDALTPKLVQFATQLQNVTAMDDAAIVNLMASLRNLGVSANQLPWATKAAMGLSEALQIDARTAGRMVSGVMQGEYALMSRYIPALRAATSEGEKQKLVTDMMTSGFAQMQAQTTTIAGGWAQLGNAFNDFMAAILTGISGGSINSLGELLSGLAFKIQQLTYYFKAGGAGIAGFFEGLKPGNSIATEIEKRLLELGPPPERVAEALGATPQFKTKLPKTKKAKAVDMPEGMGAQFTGFADWVKTMQQQATQNYERSMLEEQKRQTEQLAKIAENTAKTADGVQDTEEIVTE